VAYGDCYKFELVRANWTSEETNVVLESSRVPGSTIPGTRCDFARRPNTSSRRFSPAHVRGTRSPDVNL